MTELKNKIIDDEKLKDVQGGVSIKPVLDKNKEIVIKPVDKNDKFINKEDDKFNTK